MSISISENLLLEFYRLKEVCEDLHMTVGDAINLCANVLVKLGLIPQSVTEQPVEDVVQVTEQPVVDVVQKSSVLQEESSSPYNPYYKEEDTPTTPQKEKKRKKKSSDFPTLEEVEQYHDEQGMSTFTAVAFYDYYDQYGWLNKDGNPVRNWHALMRGWERNNQKKLRDEAGKETAKKGWGTNRMGGRSAAAMLAEAETELQQYVEAHYPLGLEGATDVQRKEVEAFFRTYDHSNEGAFTRDAVVKAVRDGLVPDLMCDVKRVGRNVVIRTVINMVKKLVLCINGSLLRTSPEQIEEMALGVLRAYPRLTMADLMLAFSRFKKGVYGDFRGRLTPVRLMEAMGKYVSWRKEQMQYCQG